MEHTTLGLFYPHDGRKLRRFITILLKKKAAIRIDRINYAQSYNLDDQGVIKKTPQKLLHITIEANKKESSINTIKKLLGQESLQYFEVQYDSLRDS